MAKIVKFTDGNGVETYKVQSTVLGIGIPYSYYFKDGETGNGDTFYDINKAIEFKNSLSSKKEKENIKDIVVDSISELPSDKYVIGHNKK